MTEATRLETTREAIALFKSEDALQAAIDELLSSGFDRAELSLLATEDTLRRTFGDRYKGSAELEDVDGVPRSCYVTPESFGEAEGGIIGGLVYVGALAATGLVILSGGGARGLAHIGFLRALEEIGIPVDEIGGTSMGSVIAAQYAAGLPLDEIVAMNRHGWLHHHPHRAYTIPFASIVTHRAAQRMLEEMFGDLDYEDCWIECFACSANLTRSNLVVHRTGRVARGTLASIAIPGVAPPIVGEDGDLLVDGGVLNNLPAALLSRGVEGAVLASDASPGVDARTEYPETPTNWHLLRDRWTRGRSAPSYPSIFETLARVAVVASTQETRRVRETADLYFHAPVDHVGIFEFHRIAEVVDVGYRAALGPLREWWSRRTAGAARPRRSTISGV